MCKRPRAASRRNPDTVIDPSGNANVAAIESRRGASSAIFPNVESIRPVSRRYQRRGFSVTRLETEWEETYLTPVKPCVPILYNRSLKKSSNAPCNAPCKPLSGSPRNSSSRHWCQRTKNSESWSLGSHLSRLTVQNCQGAFWLPSSCSLPPCAAARSWAGKSRMFSAQLLSHHITSVSKWTKRFE